MWEFIRLNGDIVLGFSILLIWLLFLMGWDTGDEEGELYNSSEGYIRVRRDKQAEREGRHWTHGA